MVDKQFEGRPGFVVPVESQRDYRSDQIKSPDKLEVGKRYAEIRVGSGKGGARCVRVLEIISVDVPKSKRKVGTLRARCFSPDGERGGFEGNLSLADFCLKPYRHGLWNATTFLIPDANKEEYL